MKNWLIATLGATVLFLYFYGKNNVNQLEKQHTNNVNALTEEVESVKNKLGEESYKVTTLESDNAELLEGIVAKDSTIARLQTLLSEYEDDIDDGGSVTVIHDTVYVDKVIAISDSNTFNYKDNWITLDGKVGDSLQFNLGIKNDYSVVIGYESNGFWKTKTPYTLVTNRNPYSEITSIKSFNVVVPQPKWSLGVTGGYGIIYNQGTLVPGVGVMFGLNYRLL